MRMFLTASQELTEFLSAIGIAFLSGLFFDFLKSICPKAKSEIAAALFDFLLWSLFCIFFCILWQKFLDGRLKWYTVFGFAATNILYFLTIHKPIFTAYCIISKKISSFFGIILKKLLTAYSFLVKIIIYISMFCKKMYIVDCEGKEYEKKRCRI